MVGEGLSAVRAALADCLDASVWALSDTKLVGELDGVQLAKAQLAAYEARLVRDFDGRGLAKAQGASSTSAWLRDRYRLGPRWATKLVGLAGEVGRRPVLDCALACGSVHAEQVASIAATVKKLSREPEVSSEVLDKAEAALVEEAASLGPDQLNRLGTRILAHVAPEIAATTTG
jgi:hypothetical protein